MTGLWGAEAVTRQPGLSDEVLGWRIAQLVLKSDLQARSSPWSQTVPPLPCLSLPTESLTLTHCAQSLSALPWLLGSARGSASP